MALKVKDAASAAKKFTTRGAAAATDYANGAVAAAGDWAAHTSASQDNWAQGVQGAVSRGAFKKGVDKAGSGSYADGVSKKGSQRFATGIQNAGDKWAGGVAPYLQAAQSANLTPRGPKGSPQNQQRAADMAALMRRTKVGS